MDVVAAATQAIQVVLAEMAKTPQALQGGGTLECPGCHRQSLRWGFTRHRTGRGPGRRGGRTAQSFRFACDTPNCVQGSGH